LAYNLPSIYGTGATPHLKAGNLGRIVRALSDLPLSSGKRSARRVEESFHTDGLTGALANSTTCDDWTCNGKMPGPIMRIGDRSLFI
jgi:hypothetical protein